VRFYSPVLFAVLIFLLHSDGRAAGKQSAYRTVEAYMQADKGALSYNYAFDISYASVNAAISYYGLSRYSKHQDELNVIYLLNAVVNTMLLSRNISVVRRGGLFYEPYTNLQKISNPELREMVAEYRLMEVSNSTRQLRRISSCFSLLSSIFIAMFSEGNSNEMIASAFMAGNSIFYLLFYESYGEDARDKYFFLKKAYPEVSMTEEGVRLALKFEMKF